MPSEGRRRGRSIAVRRVFVLVAMLAATSGATAGDRATLEALRAGDVRLGSIGYRLATANAALCTDRSLATGMIVHAIDQYPADEQAEARRTFGFDTAIAVEGVVAGSPAAMAGIRADDSIVSINGRMVPVAEGAGHVRTRDAFVALLDAQPAVGALTMVVRRAGAERRVTLAGAAGCRTLFELRPGPTLDASADGRLVQISGAFLDRFDDAQVAVVVAHELSHNILKHHDRLDAAKVGRGLLRELGRNGRLFRVTEDDADRLGVHLLRNAGWDPALAVAFWQGPGRRIAGGVFYSRTHSSPARRAGLIAQEIATLPPDAPLPYRPPVLATRDHPLE